MHNCLGQVCLLHNPSLEKYRSGAVALTGFDGYMKHQT